MNTFLVISANLHGILIGFLILVVVIAVIAGLIWCIEQYINKAPFPAPVRLVIALVLVIIVVLWALNLTACTETQKYLGTPQGQAVLATSETLATTAAQAAATYYGGPAAGQLAGAGLDALATVLQGYVGKTVPAAIVQASPGIKPVAKAVAPLVSTKTPVTQADVNTVFKAASIAAKK